MKPTKKTVVIILIIVLLVPFFLIINSVFASNGYTPFVKTPIDPYKDLLKEYEEKIKSEKTSKEEKDILKRKYEIVVYDATLRADNIKKEKPGAFETLALMTITPVPTTAPIEIADGIDKNPIIPNPLVFPKDISLGNGWHKKDKDKNATLFVYSGCLKEKPSQGVIYIKELGNSLVYKKFLAPDNSGKLFIIKEDKSQLTLRNDADQIFYFDLTLEVFTDQNGSIISTQEPISETSTPIAYPVP